MQKNKEIISMAMERKVLLIEGMTCANCQNRIEQTLRNTEGISEVHVSYSKGQAEIESDWNVCDYYFIVLFVTEIWHFESACPINAC